MLNERLAAVKYEAIMERDREEIEILLCSSDKHDIECALLSAAYYDPEWRWVQAQCLTFTRHSDQNVRWVAAICLGHLARIHRQLDLELVLQRLTEMRADPLVKPAVDDALDDIRFFLKFQ
jgi:hypothetical protein